MYAELISELTKENVFVKIQPPCSEKAINNAEKAVGFKFPKELRALLCELNGDKFLVLSAEEIVAQAELNKEIYENNPDEEFAKELNKYLFFAGNGCGDYYCYRANDDGKLDETAIYIWEHEENCCQIAAASISELIIKYYHDEI